MSVWQRMRRLPAALALALAAGCGAGPAAEPLQPSAAAGAQSPAAVPTEAPVAAGTPSPSMTAVLVEPPTAAPAQTAASSGSGCGWTWAYGAAPPAVAADAERRFRATGVAGTLSTRGYGERNSCTKTFHLKDVDFTLTLTATDLLDAPALAGLAATVAPIPGETMAGFGSVGNVDMLFVTDDAQCFWEADRCGPILSRNR